MARILIAGCGDVGGKLASNLVAKKHDVWGIRRSGPVPEGVRPLHLDLEQTPFSEALPSDLTAVFFTVAAGGREERLYYGTYVLALRNLLAALVDSGQSLRRIFFTSSTSVYQQNDGSWVDEDSPTRPEHFAGRIMLQAERELLAGPFPATVVRLSGIYGPGRERLIRRSGKDPQVQMNPPYYTNRIHRDDCAGCLAHLHDLEAPEKLYLASDRDPAPLAEVVAFIRQRLGLSAPEPAEVDRGRNKRCSSERLIASGYHFKYPSFRDGYGALLSVYQN